MDDKALKGFVSDNLFALVGLSESSLASFIVALGAFRPQAALTGLNVAFLRH